MGDEYAEDEFASMAEAEAMAIDENAPDTADEDAPSDEVTADETDEVDEADETDETDEADEAAETDEVDEADDATPDDADESDEADSEPQDPNQPHLYSLGDDDQNADIIATMDDDGVLDITIPDGAGATIGGDYSDSGVTKVVVHGGGSLQIEDNIDLPCDIIIGGNKDGQVLDGDTTSCAIGVSRPFVHAHGDAQITARGDANVIAYDNARVEAWGNSWVQVRDRASAGTHDTAICDVNDHGAAMAFDNSHADLHGQSVGMAMDDATGTVDGDSTMLCSRIAEIVAQQLKELLKDYDLTPKGGAATLRDDQRPGAPRENIQESQDNARTFSEQPDETNTPAKHRVHDAFIRIQTMFEHSRAATAGAGAAVAGLTGLSRSMMKTGQRLHNAALKPLNLADRIAMKFVPDVGHGPRPGGPSM